MEWTTALEIFGLIGGIATVLGVLLGPMIWIGSKLDAFRQEMYQENKDFHGRLIALETKRNMEDKK